VKDLVRPSSGRAVPPAHRIAGRWRRGRPWFGTWHKPAALRFIWRSKPS